MGIALSLMGIAIILFLAKSKIPNSDIERLANITAIVIFLFGLISLVLPLPSIGEIKLLTKQPTQISTDEVTDLSLSTMTLPLTYTSSGCELKELVADFGSGESLSVDYKFPTGFFSRPAASHVDFKITGPDFGDGFRVDEVLSYSITHTVKELGEYRVGFIWHGAYEAKVTIILPRKNWQIVVSDCSKE